MLLNMTPRTIPRVAAVVMAVVLGSVTAAWSAATETFVPETIQYPGSTSSAARGINNPGQIVGSYSCAVACVNPLTGETSAAGIHSFLLQNGIYTRIDVPGGTGTLARGISEQGVVVGQYNLGAVTHGFACSSPCQQASDFVYPIDVPAELFDHPNSTLRNTLVVGVSPQGDLVGCFHEDSQTMTTMHGWLLRNGTFISLSTPHFTGDTGSRDPDTMNNNIAPTGEIIGLYLSSGVSYIADDNAIETIFTFPDDQGNGGTGSNAGLFTLAWGVNPRGDVVGQHGDNHAYVGAPGTCMQNCAVHNSVGFVKTKDGDFRTLQVQGAMSTIVNGINAFRCIVGQYTDSTGSHGFVYRLKAGNQ